jgi:hypothetical protein
MVPAVSIDLGRRLIAAGLVPPDEVEAALFVAVARGVPFARVLIDRGAITERGLDEELERLGGLGLRQVAGAPELFARVPRAMCRRLAALPTRLDPQTGVVDVAAADPLDPHVAQEFGFQLGLPIRVVRAPIAAVEEAIRRLELDEPEPAAAPRQRRKTPPFPHGAPQSSNPPPTLEEAPIPLVRKSGEVKTRETEPAPPPIVRPVAVPGPTRAATGGSGTFTMGMPSEGPRNPHRATIRPDTPIDAELGRGDRAALPPEPPLEPPAVSFPSVPPRATDRITPPYGTPALAPPAVPIDGVQRSRAETLPAPAFVATLELEDEDEESAAIAAAVAAVEAPPASEDAPRPSPTVVRAPDGRPVLDALDRATDRDEVMRHCLRGMRLVGRRNALFAVKRGAFQGYRCNVELGDPDAFRELSIAAEQPSILATATATTIYLGPIPATAAHEGLLAVMESASDDVAVIAARVAGRPALILLVDGLDDTMLGTRFLIELADAAGEALMRILASK